MFLVLVFYIKYRTKGTTFQFFCWTLFPRLYFTPAKTFNRCYSKIFWWTFPFTYEFSLRTNNGDKSENILRLPIKKCFILFLERRQKYFFNESTIFLGYMTTKLFIPKSCKKNNRLFTLDRMTLLWWWERDLDFPRSPFVLWCFQRG